jgi:hypothetical protein
VSRHPNSGAPYRERQAAPRADDEAARWRFRRAVARVAVIDAILADYATSYCGLPVRRREVLPLQSAVELPCVTWSIDGEVMVEFLPADDGPGQLLVREIALLAAVKKQLRSRHVRIEYRPALGV